MGRILFLLILIICIYYLARRIFSPGPMRILRRSSPHADHPTEDTELVQDPHCQVYIPKTDALRRSVRGTTYYFCSRECADEFEQT